MSRQVGLANNDWASEQVYSSQTSTYELTNMHVVNGAAPDTADAETLVNAQAGATTIAECHCANGADMLPSPNDDRACDKRKHRHMHLCHLRLVTGGACAVNMLGCAGGPESAMKHTKT